MDNIYIAENLLFEGENVSVAVWWMMVVPSAMGVGTMMGMNGSWMVGSFRNWSMDEDAWHA
jgi:hypothetical protein